MIHVYVRNSGDSPDTVNGFEINVTSADIESFRNMVQRAVNLWPDAPAHIKEFADIITNGKAMQNYLANPHLSGSLRPSQN